MNYSQNKELRIDGEIWKPVPIAEFYEYYHVSNLGRVKSLARTWITSADYTREHPEIIMSQGIKKNNNYASVAFMANGIRKSYSVARLVAMTFMNTEELYDKKYIIAHINGDRTDNRIDNLKYVLRYDYMSHNAPSRKLTSEQIIGIKKNAAKFQPKGFWSNYAKKLDISYGSLIGLISDSSRFSNFNVATREEFAEEIEVERKKYYSKEEKVKRKKERYKKNKHLYEKRDKKRRAKIITKCKYCKKECSPNTSKQEYNFRHKGYIYCPDCVKKNIWRVGKRVGKC